MGIRTVIATVGQDYNPPPVVRTGVILTVGTTLPYDYNVLAPALEAAYETSLTRYNVKFQPILALYQGGCSVSAAAGQTHIAAYAPVDFIIGPACTDDMMMSLETQTFFDIASVSGAGELVDSTEKFPYTTRCAYNTYTQWIFAIRMFRHYGWSNIAIIYDSDDTTKVINANSLMKNIRTNNLRYVELKISSSNVRETDQAQAFLEEAGKQSRIIVILMNGLLLRTFMVGASRLGYTNGDFVFFGLDPFRDDILGRNGWKQNDKYDSETQQAYGSLFVLSLRDTSKQPQYREFAQNVRETASRLFPLTNVVLNYYVASFYDSILLYALSINETLEEGHSIGKDNVLELSTKFWNRTFPGATGQVYINPGGDRNDDHAMSDLNSNGDWQVAAEFFGYKDIQFPNYEYDSLIPFRWNNPTNTPPLNEPMCGYEGNNPICDHSGERLGIALGIVGAILIISLVIGIVIYQVFHRRAELAGLDVLGSWREITKAQSAVIKVTKKSTEMGSHTSFDQGKLMGGSPRQETITALFRGVKVMLRVQEREQIHINRTILSEIKAVRQLQNENVAKLEGICTGPHRVAVMYAFATKGSLADLLATETIKLDWLFRFSLIKDFTNGLVAIANSPIATHGRLSSTCIFVDAHFVAKIGDYGLPSFFFRSMPNIQDSAFCESLLWTAPERLPRPFDPGTEEGDVFSLSIILSEIVMRERPYGSLNTDPEVIIAKLQKKQHRSFRPKVDANLCPPEISVLMKQCWAFNPQERPRLAQIKSIIKESEKSNTEKGTILDNLIRRMENYTLDLEHVVEEKAQQFLLEKEKSEQLLYQILPRTVVDTLKRGEQVKPENFDSVTVYYSDIVAFTTLSSSSSPTEVVDLLNDLYTIFDNCIMKFDAYKVETVGDCYVVASGVPIRNGNRHAAEICRLSLLLLEQINVFKIRHRPDEKLRLRLGAHTGPCVSGVVGLVMPRFCLFGETITIAGKMESSSMPMRIQISDVCEHLLQTLGKFDTELRDGPVVVNDKLQVVTYWLHRELAG
ncbi:Atrial natriuretic peptide receptor 1 [Hypsibius exemplaris]|uniref:Guanylate cyclase n=1 Tax=Hypsibius exemplaris TaxID=2072580 RepID=A0A1W0WSP9_HYPEX|nr:Atrial natriuretic peptide receptor 1 [Hypsibius exemplaris]